MYRICVIEDETIIRHGIIASIDWQKHNCEVVGEAGNGQEGIKIIEKTKPDIIILDINMPIMDGLEMISKLPPNIYSFIIISGHSEFSYAKKAIKYNVSEYLLKPLDHTLFESALSRAINDLEMKRVYSERKKTEEDEIFKILDLDIKVESLTLSIALNYIRLHFHEKITMDDLIRETNKSSTSISNRFQDYLEMPFSEYLTKFRIQKSIDLIKDLNFHLYEISEKVGYNDYKYFNLVFKKTMGVSPKIVENYYLRKS